MTDQFFIEFEDLMRKYEVDRTTLCNVVFPDQIWLVEWHKDDGLWREERKGDDWLRK